MKSPSHAVIVSAFLVFAGFAPVPLQAQDGPKVKAPAKETAREKPLVQQIAERQVIASLE